MNTAKVCSGCGKALPADAPQGICPECLMKAGFETRTAVVTPSTKGPGFDPPLPADLARHFPQLDILEMIGIGGMGVVYKARQPNLDRIVALKILSPDAGADPAFSKRFAQEARSLARLNHPNIVAVYDFGLAGPYYYFVMEYVDGANLREMADIRKLEPREALAIIPKICDALQYAHDEGVVHRDIKPENILVDKKSRVKIADFGIAKILGQGAAATTRLTGPQSVMGTPHYMAPEQFERPLEVDHRADIYSLGVVFYEMLTGDLPLGRFAPPSTKVQIDVRLDEVVLRTLENKPDLRYQKASDLKTELENITGVFEKLPYNLQQAFGFEYRSKTELFGLPLLHIAMGVDLRTGKKRIAKGIVAIGETAKGVFAFGALAIGVVAFGGLSIGIISLGGLALGAVGFGGLAIGLIFAYGGFAVAPIAIGGLAIGYYAAGGAAWGKHAISNLSRDPEAREFFRNISGTKLMLGNFAAMAFGFLLSFLLPWFMKRRSAKKAAARR
jgi:predicted Ser/Thr protein kinase